MKNSPRLIYLAGVDGVGKSTHVDELVAHFESKGQKCKHLWLRHAHFFSFLILAYCRLRGLTKYVTIEGETYGSWEFYRSRCVSHIFPYVKLIDAAIFTFIKVYLALMRGYTIICDRFIYDTLVDLMLANRDPALHEKKVGQAFLSLIPQNSRVIFLDSDVEFIKRRRKDLSHDDSLGPRRTLYLSLASYVKAPVVSTSQPVDKAKKDIFHLVLEDGWRGKNTKVKQEKIDAAVRSPMLRRLLKFKTLALFVHWIFQGILYMDRTERGFKLGIEFILIALFCRLISFYSPNIYLTLGLSFLIAHTINWIFNAQTYQILTHFGVSRYDRKAIFEYASDLQGRIESEKSVRWAVVTGSLADGALSDTSDLDIRILRKPGLMAGIRTCWFALRERSLGFFRRFPIDIAVLDSPNHLKLLRGETPLILNDPHGILREKYPYWPCLLREVKEKDIDGKK